MIILLYLSGLIWVAFLAYFPDFPVGWYYIEKLKAFPDIERWLNIISSYSVVFACIVSIWSMVLPAYLAQSGSKVVEETKNKIKQMNAELLMYKRGTASSQHNAARRAVAPK